MINGRDGVGEATRERILRLIDEQGFRASFFAQNLAAQRSFAVGIVFPLLASELVVHPVFPELLGAVGDSLSASGYTLSLVTAPAADRNERILRLVAGGRLDGVILPDVRVGDDIVARLAELRTPTVVIGHRVEDDEAAWVDCDHDHAALELTSTLLEAGHERVALVNGPADLSACQLRREGYRRALAAAGVRASARLERSGPFSSQHGFAALSELFSLRQRERPTAVVAGSDLIAAGCLQAARAAGLRVPEEFALTGFDDQPLAAFLQPPLTTARMPIGEMGRAAAGLLQRLIEGENVRPRSLVLPTEIVVRESSGGHARWIF